MPPDRRQGLAGACHAYCRSLDGTWDRCLEQHMQASIAVFKGRPTCPQAAGGLVVDPLSSKLALSGAHELRKVALDVVLADPLGFDPLEDGLPDLVLGHAYAEVAPLVFGLPNAQRGRDDPVDVPDADVRKETEGSRRRQSRRRGDRPPDAECEGEGVLDGERTSDSESAACLAGDKP